MGKVTCLDIHENAHDVDEEDLSFRPSVYGVVIKNEKVLLVPQFDGYDFPGGGMDIGETIEECLLREVQ
jgi:8-oxo-dGTP pyrophosphatase MutT (NUDIX family)